MHVWVIKAGEPLPIDGANYRPHRIGMLADALTARGHRATWWTSTLNHQSKQQRFDQDTVVNVRDRFQIQLLHSMGYTRNVSLRRLADHVQLGQRFKRAIQLCPRPDLIFCCYPTIELAAVAVDYGRRHNVPVVVDVRDLWPDVCSGIVPKRLRSLTGMALAPYVRQTRRIFRRCTGIVGISDGYLRFGLNYAERQRTENDQMFALGFQRPIVAENQMMTARSFLRSCGVDSSRTVCWFAGMLGTMYDLTTVIDAARRLARHGVHDIQFVLSGAGESLARLKARANGLDNVVFTGRIDAVQLAAMAEIADIGLMAYAAGAPQGLPNKLNEYMCAGLPIVSSLEGETATFLRERRCGISYVADDAASLSEVIETLGIDAGLRRTMGDNGRRIFDREYAAENVYGRLATFLESVAGDPRTSCVEAPRTVLQEAAMRAA